MDKGNGGVERSGRARGIRDPDVACAAIWRSPAAPTLRMLWDLTRRILLGVTILPHVTNFIFS